MTLPWSPRPDSVRLLRLISMRQSWTDNTLGRIPAFKPTTMPKDPSCVYAERDGFALMMLLPYRVTTDDARGRICLVVLPLAACRSLRFPDFVTCVLHMAIPLPPFIQFQQNVIWISGREWPSLRQFFCRLPSMPLLTN